MAEKKVREAAELDRIEAVNIKLLEDATNAHNKALADADEARKAQQTKQEADL